MSATHISGPLVVGGTGANTMAGSLAVAGALTVGATGVAASSTSVTAGVTLTVADHGKIIFLADAASGDVTLPAVTTTGFSVRVLCNFTITTSSGVISAEGDNIDGVLTVNNAMVRAAAEDQINFIANTALVGDYIDIVSNGTTWTVTGVGDDAGSITATDPA